MNMNGESNPCKYGYPDHRIGIHAGIQGAIFSISNVFIQSGINTFGEDAIAGSSLALNFEYFTYDIAAAFAQAAVTFTSQNYGAGKTPRHGQIPRAFYYHNHWNCCISNYLAGYRISIGSNIKFGIVWGQKLHKFFVRSGLTRLRPNKN